MREKQVSKLSKQSLVFSPARRILVINGILAAFWLVISLSNLPILPGSAHWQDYLKAIGGNIFYVCLALYTAVTIIFCLACILIYKPSVVANAEMIAFKPSLFSFTPIVLRWSEIKFLAIERNNFSWSLAFLLAKLYGFSYVSIVLMPETENDVLSRQRAKHRIFFQKRRGTAPTRILISRAVLPYTLKEFAMQLQSVSSVPVYLRI